MAPTPTARAADLLLPSRVARLDRSIPLLIAHAIAASNGTASCSDRASRSLAAGCAPALELIFGRTTRSSSNYQSTDSSASMLTDVYPAQPRNAAILAIALQSSYLLLTPSAKTKTIRRWRPTKLITACTTPRAPLPNMDSLFQPRKSHCQNIARSMFHNL